MKVQGFVWFTRPFLTTQSDFTVIYYTGNGIPVEGLMCYIHWPRSETNSISRIKDASITNGLSSHAFIFTFFVSKIVGIRNRRCSFGFFLFIWHLMCNLSYIPVLLFYFRISQSPSGFQCFIRIKHAK